CRRRRAGTHPRSAARGGREGRGRARDLGRPRRATWPLPSRRRDAARPDRRRARGCRPARGRCARSSRRNDDRRGEGRMKTATKRQLQAVAIVALVTLAIGSALMLLVGKPPGTVWWEMITRTTNDPYKLGTVLYKATALVFTGLAVS